MECDGPELSYVGMCEKRSRKCWVDWLVTRAVIDAGNKLIVYLLTLLSLTNTAGQVRLA